MSPKEAAKGASKGDEMKRTEEKAPHAQSKTDKPPQEEEELSEEDQKLKEELDMLVERLAEPDTTLHPAALESLRTLIRTSTSSMTAVPKPLKFLRPHYPRLQEVYEQWPSSNSAKPRLADMLSVLAMTASEEDKGGSLRYRLLVDDGEDDDFGQWGHEYMRHLALEIGNEFRQRQEDEKPTGDLLDLALRIAPFFLKHNAEADAVDILLEVESVDRLVDFVDNQTYPRVCRYLVGCASYLDKELGCLETAYKLYLRHNELTSALAVILAAHQELEGEYMREIFTAAGDDEALQKQLALILARQRRLPPDFAGEEGSEVAECAGNGRLSEYFRYLTKELNLDKPKMPQDVFRSGPDVPSAPLGMGPEGQAKLNLASIFVRGFLNAGYANDPLLSDAEAAAAWIHRQARGPVNQACATTSLGLLHLWNQQDALQELDKHFHSSEEAVRAGALMGVGVATTGIHDDMDAAMGLLSEYLEEGQPEALQTSAILGLAFAYAGTARSDLADLLEPLVDSSKPMEVCAVACLALGVIFVGSDDGTVVERIMTAFLERSAEDLNDPWAWFMALGFALLYCNKPDELDTAVQAIQAVEHPISRVLEVLLVICAYCGTGDVLQLQWLLKQCTILPYEDEEDASEAEASDGEGEGDVEADHEAEVEVGVDATSPTRSRSGAEAAEGSEQASSDVATHQTEPEQQSEDTPDDGSKLESAKLKGLCTLGIAVVAMGEEIGQDMALRHFEHLMHFGDSYIKQSVPLALGLLSASNPQMRVYETLSRYTHDADMDVAINAIFAMGLVGAGTVNARIAQLLRQLDAYYSRAADPLFMVRFAQGMVQLGKGTLTLNPFNTDRQVLSPVSFAGHMVVSMSLLVQPRSFALSQHPSLLYFLVLAMQPRMLVTVDENLKPLKVTVRVGQAVDVVGQAGRPKTITGWVTHTTPVLLGVGERAELEDDDYIPLSSTLEGVVILRPKPDDQE